MQAVILAGGESSRFFPFNQQSKALVSVLGEPVIAHTIRAIKRAGISDIVILTGPENHFEKCLSNGKRFGVKINYASLSAPTGMGDGLIASAKFIKSDFFLVNPQHAEFDELKKSIDEKRKTNSEAVLLAKKYESNKSYGVLKIEGDRVLEIVEKPVSNKHASNLRVIGVYFLNQEFIEILKKIKSEHYSFEKALNIYAKKGKVKVAETTSDVLTLKYPWDMLGIKDYLLLKQKRNISKQANVSKLAVIEGPVVIEAGAKISENAVIKGPVYIGKNVFVGSNTLIRNHSDMEEGARIGAYMEIRGSLIGKNTSTHSGFIGDSVIGSNTKIGALFGTANVRLDRKDIRVLVKGEKTDSHLRALGVLAGENVVIGERVSTMPGVIIGNNSIIGPSTTVMKNVPSDVTYYTKFAEAIEKNNPASSETARS